MEDKKLKAIYDKLTDNEIAYLMFVISTIIIEKLKEEIEQKN